MCEERSGEHSITARVPPDPLYSSDGGPRAGAGRSPAESESEPETDSEEEEQDEEDRTRAPSVVKETTPYWLGWKGCEGCGRDCMGPPGAQRVVTEEGLMPAVAVG